LNDKNNAAFSIMNIHDKLGFFLFFIRHPSQAWRKMNPHGNLKFVLSIIRHPRQAWPRIRELTRMASAPSLSNRVPSDNLANVEMLPVVSDEALRARLVAMYTDNPSPYVRGPLSIEQLQEKLDRGIRYYLVTNRKGEYVGARAFDPSKKMLRNTVSDFRHRGKGYQLAAGKKLRELLANEGYTEFRAAVLRTNTRIQRQMEAAGWKMAPDPNDPNLVLGTLRLDRRPHD
jgi:hypothetical protein